MRNQPVNISGMSPDPGSSTAAATEGARGMAAAKIAVTIMKAVPYPISKR